MLQKAFGRFGRVLVFGERFEKFRLSARSRERVRRAREGDLVAFVMRSPTSLDARALDLVLKRCSLPVRFAPPQSFQTADSGATGVPLALLVRVEPARKAHRRTGQSAMFSLQELIQYQRQQEMPIQVLPVLVVWNRAPERRRSWVGSLLWGTREYPAPWIGFWEKRFNARDWLIQVAEPLDLRDFLAQPLEIGAEERLHSELERRFLAEWNALRGPELLSPALIRKRLLAELALSPEVEVEEHCSESRAAISRAEFERDFRKIASDFRFAVIRLMDWFLQPLWTVVFSDVELREQDAEKIRDAMRSGTAVLVPCHRSHFDVLMLGWAYFTHDLCLPHIVTGMNLAFFPLGFLLRKVGGVFVKRSFAGAASFPVVFSHYLRTLLRIGYPIQFFLEGGRSRSGRMLLPRHGVLRMLMDAAAEKRAGEEVSFIPLALAYEQVAEERAHAREEAGEPKRPESAGQFLGALAFFKQRFGRVYLRVGTPVACSSLIGARAGVAAWRERSEAERRAEVDRVGRRLVHRMAEAMPVLGVHLVAAALLNHPEAAVSQGAILRRARIFRDLLRECGAEREEALESDLEGAVCQALSHYARRAVLHDRGQGIEGDLRWEIPGDQRLILAFYQNHLAHFLVRMGAAALALKHQRTEKVLLQQIRENFNFLLRLFSREALLEPEGDVGELLEQSLQVFAAVGVLERSSNQCLIQNGELLAEAGRPLAPLLESYRLVLRASPQLDSRPLSSAEYVQWVREHAAGLFEVSALRRPEVLARSALESAVASWERAGLFTMRGGLLARDAELVEAKLALLDRYYDHAA